MLPVVAEPVEIIALVSGGDAYSFSSAGAIPVRCFRRGPGFPEQVRTALRTARFDWVYLFNPGMRIEPQTLDEALRWRAPHVFAIGSHILGSATSGWNGARMDGDTVSPFAADCEASRMVRGTLYADGRAALFRADALRGVLARRDPYLERRWNEVEWGVRAWRAGYEILFCPASRARQTEEMPVPAPSVRRRDQLQLDLRNAWSALPFGRLIEMTLQGDRDSHAGLWRFGNAWRILGSRLRAYAAPIREVPWSYVRQKYYPAPWNRRDRRPILLVVTPYAVLPPTHGGAHRIHGLLKHVGKEYQIVLLSDEEKSYGSTGEAWFAPFRAVHLVGGRKEAASGEPARITRMRSHSHRVLGDELARIVRIHRPDLVQIEYVELALLARWRNGPAPWLLTLHDVLLSGGSPESPEDRFERDWMNRFDHLIACCDEDAQLLRGMPASAIPNGAAIPRESYISSAGLADVLFLGPFRYGPNWDGILEFLRVPYPALRARFSGIRVHILGGIGARARASRCEEFDQSGVHVHDHVEDVEPWLRMCALTINPIRNNRGSCLKVIQSLAAGRVCVSTREGARGFLHCGFRGLVVVDAVEDFTAAMTGLLKTEAARLELEAPDPGKLERYTWPYSAERQMEIYRRVIHRRRGRDD